MNLYLNHFPKHEKYGLAQQMRQCLYTMYGLIVEAQKRYHKKTALAQLDIEHEKLRWFNNLAWELGYYEFDNGRSGPESRGEHRFMVLSRLIDEVGRMVGGWMQFVRQEAAQQEGS